MLEPVSVALKFGFLAVLYLFLLWVAWSALRDMRRSSSGVLRQPTPADATSMYTPGSPIDGDLDGFDPRLLVERAPGHEPGTACELDLFLRPKLHQFSGRLDVRRWDLGRRQVRRAARRGRRLVSHIELPAAEQPVQCI